MIYQQIKDDIKIAMKEKDAARVMTLRTLDAEIQNKLIALKAKEPTDEIVISVLQKGVKQREESIDAFILGHRPELATEEKLQVLIYKVYLPTMMSKTEVRIAVMNEIVNNKVKVDMGSLMKVISPKLKGKADGKLINDTVKEIINTQGGSNV